MKTHNKRFSQRGAAGDRRAPRPERPNARATTPAGWKNKFDSYVTKAQAWAAAGDAVEAENCYQHAEHYLRLIRGTAA